MIEGLKFVLGRVENIAGKGENAGREHLQITTRTAQIMISVSDKTENIVGKGENADYQHFCIYHTLKRLFLQRR